MNSLRHDLELVLPQLPVSLATPACRSQMLQIAAFLPSPAISKYGFEAWLGADGGRSDFLYKIGPSPDRFQAWLADRPQLQQISPEGTSPADQISADWLAGKNDFRDFITDLWLEHDIEPAREFCPAPHGTFIGLKEGAFQNQFPWLCDVLLPRILPATPPPELRQHLEMLARSLPSSTHFFHLGTLPARQHHALRVCITELTFESWIAFLSQLFPRDRSSLTDSLQILQSLCNCIVVDFDLWESISPRLGFECYIWDRLPVHAAKWPVLFSTLVQMNLMSHQQADDLLRWPGYSDSLNSNEKQVRRLHHIKMTWHNGFQRAKAYFGIEKMPFIKPPSH